MEEKPLDIVPIVNDIMTLLDGSTTALTIWITADITYRISNIPTNDMVSVEEAILVNTKVKISDEVHKQCTVITPHTITNILDYMKTVKYPMLVAIYVRKGRRLLKLSTFAHPSEYKQVILRLIRSPNCTKRRFFT